MKKRFSEEQIIGFLRESDKGIALKELCRKHGFSEASYYLWRKYGGMDVSDARRLKALEVENARLRSCWRTRCWRTKWVRVSRLFSGELSRAPCINGRDRPQAARSLVASRASVELTLLQRANTA